MQRTQDLSSCVSLLTAAVLVAACSGGGGIPSGLQVRRSNVSVAADTTVAISGKHLAFLADEATTGTGTDMNGDGDTTDSAAVVIDMSAEVETNLGIAAASMAWIGGELYLSVDESLDGRDWSGDSDTNDLALLHVSAARPTQAPDFIETLSNAVATKMIPVGNNLFYSRARAPADPFESSISRVSTSAPTTPVPVPTRDPVEALSPRILAKDEGMLFFSLDETVEGRDLNGDGDSTDTSVLALLDATSSASAIHSTGLAMPPDSPLRARKTSAHDWDVGFLVSESDQAATNLNDPALFDGAWKPSQCTGLEDTDATDSVLHFLEFADWDADAALSPPVNTGLVGCRKIAIANGYIATITPEFDAADANGAEGGCDLNLDGDKLDYVMRWVQMSTTVLPLTRAADLHALTDVPGGTHGLSELGIRFVVEVSESQDNRDINADGAKTFDYLGWLLPAGNGDAPAPCDFTHGPDYLTQFGASWMSETLDRSRLLLAVEERSYGIPGAPGRNLNAHDPPNPGEDVDELDSLPSVASFSSSPVLLTHTEVPFAAQSDDTGFVFARDMGFYRVSEADDSRDWNGDILLTSYVLFRTTYTPGDFVPMGGSASLPGQVAITINLEETTPLGTAFIADEQFQAADPVDLNADGDDTDLVISYFTF